MRNYDAKTWQNKFIRKNQTVSSHQQKKKKKKKNKEKKLP